MDGPLAPEPGDGSYFFVGVLAVVVVILGVVVIRHPMPPIPHPAHAIDAVFGPEPMPARLR